MPARDPDSVATSAAQDVSTTGSSTPTPPPRPASRRLPLWDNARWIAITCVVVGHAIEVLGANDFAWGLYLAIYSFHMPLFAFVSGRFSKGGALTLGEAKGILTRIVLPLVYFQCIWTLVAWWRTGGLQVNFVTPRWILWFLLSLALWRLTLPLFSLMRHPFLVSVAVACVSGYAGGIGTIAATSRTLVFLPFFVAGWCLQERGGMEQILAIIQRLWVRLIAAVLVVGAVVVSVRNIDLFREQNFRKWFQGEWNYERLGNTDWWAGGERALVMAFSFLMIFAVLAIVPRRQVFFTKWGARTMNVYLLHLFPIVVLTDLELINMEDPTTAYVLGAIAIAIVWSMILSTKVVDVLAGPLTHPQARWLLVKDETERRGRRVATS